MKDIMKTGSCLLLLLFFITGCGYHEGIVQTDQKSYVWFKGNTGNAVAFIDENEPFKLEKNYYVNEATGETVENTSLPLYQVSPGKHKIIVKRNDAVIVERIVLINNGTTKEILVP